MKVETDIRFIKSRKKDNLIPIFVKVKSLKKVAVGNFIFVLQEL